MHVYDFRCSHVAEAMEVPMRRNLLIVIAASVCVAGHAPAHAQSSQDSTRSRATPQMQSKMKKLELQKKMSQSSKGEQTLTNVQKKKTETGQSIINKMAR